MSSWFKSIFSDFLSSDDLLIGPELEDQIRFAQGRRKSSSALIQQDQRRRNSHFWDFLAAKSDRKTQNLDLSKEFSHEAGQFEHFLSRVWCTFLLIFLVIQIYNLTFYSLGATGQEVIHRFFNQ